MQSTLTQPIRQLPSWLPKVDDAARRIMILTGRLAQDAGAHATQFPPDRVHRFAVNVLRYAHCPRTLDRPQRQTAIDQFTQVLHCWICQHELIATSLVEIQEALLAACWKWHQPADPETPSTPTLPKQIQQMDVVRSQSLAYLYTWLEAKGYEHEVMYQVLADHFDAEDPRQLSTRQLKHLRSVIHTLGPEIQRDLEEQKVIRFEELERQREAHLLSY